MSKVLIKQFCNEGKTNVFDLETKTWRDQKSPSEIAFVIFPEKIIKKSEKKWNNLVEKRYQNVLDSLWQGTFFKNNKNIEVVKSLIALHFTRSFSFMYLLNKHERDVYCEYFEETIKKYNLEPKQIRSEWLNHLADFFPNLIDDQLNKVQSYIFGYNLEIGIAPKRNKFILGDSPVVNISEDKKIGLLKGVALKDSIGLFLPLTPRHLVALTNNKTNDAYIKLTAKNIREINQKTKNNCLKEFYAF